MEALIISNALDTNGQNARYAKASEKWGTDEGVLKALAVGHYDPAGVVGRFQAAAEKFGNLRIRSVHRAHHIYQQMPADIIWDHHNQRMIRELADEADIIHLNNSVVALRRLGIRHDKPTLLHHHGSLFRNNPGHLLSEARNYGSTQCVSTVDLMRVAPHLLHWAPTAYDIDWLIEFGKANKREPDGKLRIVQCPTDGKGGEYKSTHLLEAAVTRIQTHWKRPDVELVVVRDKPWLEAMAIKASADIYFDQVKLGYGCNAVEAWGMGIPVIAGADAWTLAKMREVYGTERLPFYEATEESIEHALLDLITSKVNRGKYAKRGMEHVRKFHDELPALTRLAELYRMAIEHQGEEAAKIDVPPATFIATIPQIRLGGRTITFSKGPFTTDNAALATALRARAMRFPREGIEEVDAA